IVHLLSLDGQDRRRPLPSFPTRRSSDLAAAVLAQMISLSGFAGVQQRLLRAGGVRVGHWRSASVIYGSTAMAVTLPAGPVFSTRSEEHTSELQSRENLVCRLLLEKKKYK